MALKLKATSGMMTSNQSLDAGRVSGQQNMDSNAELLTSADVLVLQVCILFAQVLANSGAGIEDTPVTGAWNQWSAWSPCSAKCRTGITVRNRTCHHSLRLPRLSLEGDSKPRCAGKDKELKLCNKQECPDGSRGWRDEECTKYDSSVHSGRQYTWEPFTHASDPCALTCRAKGHHFYTTLADTVVDGTPCRGATTSPSAICLQGVCEEVGCDDMVGSPWRRDACGVCMGDNSTCRTVSGVFSQDSLEEGMNQITLIPAGSTLINITGLHYSINWLALQNEQGHYILNGGEIKSPAGDYEAAGTIFSYKTSQKCSGQCITAQGPIDQEIKLMLSTRGDNRGIQYSFNVPNDVTDDYFRRIIDPSVESNVTLHETSSQDVNSRSEGEESDDEDRGDDAENDDLDDRDAVAGFQFLGPDSAAVSEGGVEEGKEERNGAKLEEEEEEEEEEEWQQKEQQKQQNQDQGSDQDRDDDDLYSYENDDQNGEADIINSDSFNDDMSVDSDDSDSASSKESSNEVEESDEILEPSEEETEPDDPLYQGDDEKDVEESWDSEYPAEVGAPEPLLESRPENNVEVKTVQPEFVDSEDIDQDLDNAGSSTLKSEGQSESDDISIHTPQGSSSHNPPTTDPSAEESKQTSPTASANPQNTASHQTTESQHTSSERDSSSESDPTQANKEAPAEPTISYSDQPQRDTGVTHKQTSRPQEDSPSRRPASPQQPPRNSSRRFSSRRRFRRPNYSQSFTFRRRHRQRGQAVNSAPGRRPSSGSRVEAPRSNPGSRMEAPRIRVNPPASNSRRIRFRIPPQRQSPQRVTVGGITGYRQPPVSRDPYQRIHSRSRHHSRQGPSQRQALTLGHSASRDEDGFLTIRNGNTPSPTDNNLQHSRHGHHRRRQQESSRQQREYARQQEEYRREMLRRRQKMEQQRAAQQAEYQRRLEEHKRRMLQRKLEHQRRQQQHNNNNHHHRRRHHGHHQQHSKNNKGKQPHHEKQENVHASVPTNGMLNRVDTPGNGSPSHRRRGNDVRYRTPEQRQETSPVHATAAPTVAFRTDSAAKRQNLVPTDPSTRDFLTNPAQQTISPTRPALLPNSISGGVGPAPPQFIPEESRLDARSSLSGSSSNELPGGVITPLVIGPEGNVVPTVNERRLVVGGEGSILAVEGQGDKMSYEWRVSGLTDCSLTCGGGMQQSAVVCLDTRTQAVVTNGNCAHVPQPEIKTVTCNTRPCPAEWQSSQWSACSVSCGQGEQTRLVACTARVSPTLNLTRPEENCQGLTKPEARRLCQGGACTVWKTGKWSQCSVQCGEGVRTRDVFCADQTGYDVSEDLCSGSKPEAEEACEMGACGKGWYYTQWSDQCPAKCGTGKKSRRVACMGEGGEPLPPSSCDPVTRPEPHQACRSPTPCGGQWFSGEWSECNVTCGAGHQTREVLCMKSSPGRRRRMVSDENCVMAAKPEDAMPCQMDACAVEWFVTSWTKCSQSCGAGQRTREVKCLDPQQRPSSDCPLADKPRTREACNTHRCAALATRPPPSPAAGARAECRDTFSRCEIVRHARMCRYPFYKKKCCATCSQDT